jgi:hypothetical protein
MGGVILKTTDGGASFVENDRVQGFEGPRVRGFKIVPNPFLTFAKVPGQEGEKFEMYDITGRQVGIYKGDRIGWNVGPGVYFLRRMDERTAPVRVVKVR